MRWVSLTIPVTLLAAENEPIFDGRPWWRTKLFRQDRGVDVAVRVLGNHHDISDRLPRQGGSVGMRDARTAVKTTGRSPAGMASLSW